MFIDIQPGHQYAVGQKVIEIDGAISPTLVSARDVISGECLTIPVGELTPLKKPNADRRDIRKIPEGKWEQAKQRANLLLPLVREGRIAAETLDNVSTQLGLSPRQVQRLINALRQDPRISTAAGKKPGRPIGSRMLTDQTEQVIKHCIRKYYQRPERPTVAYTWERIDLMCRRLHLPSPSRMTVSRRIDSLNRYENAVARQGRRAAQHAFRPQTGSHQANAPLQVVQIDHTRVDAMVVIDDVWREVLGRPWLTLAIDVYSRCVLGFYLSMDAPSSTSTALCIAHAILPKEEWLKTYGINDVKWPMYGKPIKIHTDNGADFRANALARGCDEQGIILEHRPVGVPEWGGHIERLIGTIMGRVHLLPGTTFSNSTVKGDDYDSESKACLTLGELREWLVRDICSRYHVTPHRGIGTSPAKAWERGLAQMDTKED